MSRFEGWQSLLGLIGSRHERLGQIFHSPQLGKASSKHTAMPMLQSQIENKSGNLRREPKDFRQEGLVMEAKQSTKRL